MSKIPATLAIAATLLASTSLAQGRGEEEKSSIKAASDCVAAAALKDPNIITLYGEDRLKEVTDRIVLHSSVCDKPLRAMRQLHDRIYGEGTGRRFLRGDYLDDLPRAVRERISSEIDVDKSRANRGNGPRIWERDTLTNGANLKVVNVNANDVLMMREYPTENSRVVYTVPPDETGIVYQGEERGQWVFVEYERARGWVKRLFVQPLPSRGGRF